MQKISFDQLTQLIDDFASGKKSQSRPMIIWTENIRDHYSKYTPYPDNAGFCLALAESNPAIGYMQKVGSPLTDHKRRFDRNGNIVNITEEERYEFCIDSSVIKVDNNGHLLTKLYLHSPILCYFGEDGLTSIQYGAMVHDRLKLPVILIFSKNWQSRVKEDLSAYDQFLCDGVYEIGI